MRISHVHIENFRNFRSFDAGFGQNIVLVGENKSGKTNFIHALRLVLDPSLSYNDRQLTEQDFWDGDGEPPFSGRQIKIAVQFTDFAAEASLPLSWLGNCLIAATPKPVAQLTYLYYEDRQTSQEPDAKARPSGPEDYTHKIYSGNNPSTLVNQRMQRDMPLSLIEPLRNIASDNRAWRRSPLNPLLKLSDITLKQLEPYANEIKQISERIVREIPCLKTLETEIQVRIETMIGGLYRVDPQLGLDAITSANLLEDLLLFAESPQRRSLDRISLGLQNVLYLSLLSLLLEKQAIKRKSKKEPFMPIVALEEPEAHLHPHLQRLVFRDFLGEATKRKQPVIITTHSPQLASAASLNDLVLFRTSRGKGCRSASAHDFVYTLNERAQKDLERFLDITKSEMLFSKGVIFVEGDVEVLLVDEFAEILCKPLDKYGISICNIYGTHFGHVLTLAHKFEIPWVVLTDGDKYCPTTGLKRGIDLLEFIRPTLRSRLQGVYDNGDKEKVGKVLRRIGIFVNDWTLEPSLLEAGLGEELKQTFEELGRELGENVKAGASHIDEYLADPNDKNMEKILLSISDSRWGKGRFAQRLLKHIRIKAQSLATQQEKDAMVPEYIKSGIECVIARVKPEH